MISKKAQVSALSEGLNYIAATIIILFLVFILIFSSFFLIKQTPQATTIQKYSSTRLDFDSKNYLSYQSQESQIALAALLNSPGYYLDKGDTVKKQSLFKDAIIQWALDKDMMPYIDEKGMMMSSVYGIGNVVWDIPYNLMEKLMTPRSTSIDIISRDLLSPCYYFDIISYRSNTEQKRIYYSTLDSSLTTRQEILQSKFPLLRQKAAHQSLNVPDGRVDIYLYYNKEVCLDE